MERHQGRADLGRIRFKFDVLDIGFRVANFGNKVSVAGVNGQHEERSALTVLSAGISPTGESV
jgi:hypothetical protein